MDHSVMALSAGTKLGPYEIVGPSGAVRAHTAFLSASAIRVCHPGPVAFHRASVSGGSRSEMAIRALPVFGRPRGRSNFSAVAFPNSLGRTSRAGFARLNVFLVHPGLSRSVSSGFLLGFIPFYLALVGLSQADDMRSTCSRCEHQHVHAISDVTKRLKSPFAVIAALVFNDQRTRPIEVNGPLERNTTQRNVCLVLLRVVADAHLLSVYAYIQ